MKQEPWLCGPMAGIDPFLMPAAHALAQTAEDLIESVKGLTDKQLWMTPSGIAPVGFHLRHIAGSIDRLLTYTRGENLSPAQFEALLAESTGDESIDAQTLTREAVGKIREAIKVIGSTPADTFFEPRAVGRKKLPTNVFGLLFHIAEHTQRHTGQVITTAKVVRRNA